MVENGYILCGVRVICAQRNDCNGFSYGGNGGDEKKSLVVKKKLRGGVRWVMDLLSQYRENGLEIAGPKR